MFHWRLIFLLITTQVDTPRFGLLQLMETVRPVKKGEEIFSNYGYRTDFLREPMKGKEWYYDQWQEYKKAYPNSPKIKWEKLSYN